MALRLLSVAVTSRRIGYVFLVGDKLVDWRISDRAAFSAEMAAAWARKLMADLRPDVVLTEGPAADSRKGGRTKTLIVAVAAVAAGQESLHVSIAREQAYANKYEEAEAIARRYQELEPWLPPKRRYFENEPRSMVIFEAMAIALSILSDPAGKLGAAMG